MRYYLLLVLVSSAAYAFTSVLVAGCVCRAWPAIRRRIDAIGPSAAARRAAALRLAPAAAGAVIGPILAGSFIRFEPVDTAETPGILLLAGAAFTFAMVLWAGVRLLRTMQAAQRSSRLLRAGGRTLAHADGTRLWVLDSHYPIAAVVGIFKTRLLLSTRVMAECTGEELDAIVSHERAHIRRRDNLVRAAMLYLPNPLALLATGREMQVVWAAAAEEAADEAAAGHGSDRRVTLAAALVRVAKMATGPMPEWIGGLAFYEGDNLERRVRRLLQDGHGCAGFDLRDTLAITGVALACALLLTNAAALQLHAWMEAAVKYLP